ncbi:MAG: hypothetical protein GY799_29635 [Desulfobulbaceae bacterium]|nr:hypothetical protein [Desulfobulbaceae bacterium]
MDLENIQSLAINPLLEIRDKLKNASETIESETDANLMRGLADNISRIIDNTNLMCKIISYPNWLSYKSYKDNIENL